MTEKTHYLAKVGAVAAKVLKVVIITVAVLTVIVLSLLPFVLRWEIVSLLEQKGMEAEVGYIDIRPIMGSVQINDVRIAAPDGKRLNFDEMQVNITWGSVVDRWLDIEHVLIEGATLDIVAGEKGVRVAGIEFLADDKSSSSEPDTESEPVPPVISRLVLEKLELDELEVCFAKLNNQNEEVFNQCARINHLSLIDHFDLHLGENPSAVIPGIVLNGFRWSDQQASTELVSVDSLKVTNVTSADMKGWQVDELSLEALRVLPISVKGEMTAGDLWLNTLTLTDLKVGEANKIGALSLTNLNVDLRSDNEGGLVFAPALMERINQLAPENKEDVPEPTEQAGSFSMGRLDVNKIVVRDMGGDAELVPTPLAFIDSFNIVGMNSDDMVGWQMGELSVGMLRVLPVLVKGEMTAGDMQLKALSLSGLEIGDTSKIDALSLGSVKVDLRSADDGRLVFAPELMERLGLSDDNNSEAEVSETPGKSSSFVLGDLLVGDAVVRDIGRDRDLLSMKNLSLKQLATNGDALKLGLFQVSDLKLLEPQSGDRKKTDYYFTTPKIELADIAKDAGQLSVSNILVVDPVAFLHRGADGELVALNEIERMTGSEGNEPELSEKSDQSPPVKLSINKIKIGGKGQLLVLDESVSPVFEQTFADLDLTLNNIDANAPKTKTNLKFNIGINKFGHFRFDGSLAPFGDKLDSAITGELRGLDVRYLSAYASEYIGHHLDQGIGEADITFDVNQDEIDATITTRFHKLEVSPLSEDEIPEGSEALGIPLEFALGLLRDNEGMIELKLPISGDIHSPDFSLSYIIGKVMFKVISEAIVNYYMPFGLIMAATMQDTLSSLSFEPVFFAPGEAELDAVAIASLDKLSEMLNSRQQLHLLFCAPSTLQDWSVKFAPPVVPEAQDQDEKKQAGASESAEGSTETIPKEPIIVIAPEHVAPLEALANQRSEIVKGYLISVGVPAGQVVLCDAAFDKNNKELPQMDIAI